MVELSIKHLNRDSIEQYQTEERTMMAFRVASSKFRLMDLMNIMTKDKISSPEKLESLKKELADYFNHPPFLKCKSMGAVVKTQLKHTLRRNLVQVQKQIGKSED